MTKLLTQVRDWVAESFKHDAAQMLHFDRTVYWVQQLRPEADEAFLIAAISHDIERAFFDPGADFAKTKKSYKDEEHLDRHQNKGAEIIAAQLQMFGADENTIQRVKHLVSRHEVGGDEEQNVLMDADSLSFVENNAPIFLLQLEKVGYEKVKEKFDWMYERISSDKARQFAKPMYDKMVAQLEAAKRK